MYIFSLEHRLCLDPSFFFFDTLHWDTVFLHFYPTHLFCCTGMWVCYHALTFLLEILSNGDSYVRNFRDNSLEMDSGVQNQAEWRLFLQFTQPHFEYHRIQLKYLYVVICFFLLQHQYCTGLHNFSILVNNWSFMCQLWYATREILHILYYNLKPFRWHWHSRLLRMTCRCLGSFPGTCGKQLLYNWDMREAAQDVKNKN